MKLKSMCKSVALISSASLFCLPIAKVYALDFEVGDTKASLYGYAKLDIFYDVDSALGATSYRGVGARLDGSDGSDGHFSMQATESRLGLRTSTVVGGSDLVTVIEGDFFGAGGGFRLRHAYGQWNGVLAGQTWSNFGSGIAVTPLLDFSGTSGNPLAHRQTQVRYTNGNISVSIEEPDAIGGVIDAVGAKNSLPDITVRYTDRSGAFKYSASGVGRYFEYDTAGIEVPASDDSEFGWAIGFEASLDLTEALTVRAGTTFGDGYGGYVNGNPEPIPAYADVDGNLQTITTVGGTVGASLKAGSGAMNIAYSRVENEFDDNPTYLEKNEKIQELWLNYIWSPANRIEYGVEAGWHERKQTDGRKGDALRLQGMLKYSF